MKALFGKTIDLLTDMLDFRSARHKVIVSNIANLDTAGYKPKELVFKESLAEATARGSNVVLTRTHPGHLAPLSGRDGRTQLTQAGDKVEIDREMTNLSENNLMYNLTVELLSRRFKGIDTTLREIK